MDRACWWLADWKKLAREWADSSARGQQQLAKIADCVQKTTYLDGEHWGVLSDCELLHDRAAGRLWHLAHRCRRRVLTEIDTLADVYAKMRALLNQGKTSDRGANRQRYESFLVEVLAMYEHELLAKSLIASDMFECTKHDTMTVYLASWQMQPHIDRARIEEIELLIQNDRHYQ